MTYDIPEQRHNGLGRTIGLYLPHLVYGANDGIVTTLVVIASVAGAALSANVVLILGLANLLADGFSMAASNVQAERSTPTAATRPPLPIAYRRGFATFVGFVLAGLVPLAAYLLPGLDGVRLPLAGILAVIALFGIGAGRALFSDRRWLTAGLEMLLFGVIAGAVAYAVGALGARLIA
jgi:VIT1/CCC1 family predicted Fe2+/Mn2+ transporter